MRGSLDRPRKKATQQNLDKVHTKKAREAPDSSHNQHGDTNIENIFLPNMASFDKAKRMKLKPIRGSLDTEQSQANLKVSVQEGNTNMDAITLPNMLSLDKAKSNSTKGESMRLKMKPVRASLKTIESQAKPPGNGEKSNTNMDGMSFPDMLRFLEKEEALLTQLQSKMSDELSRLQVEEHVFLHTLKILSQKHASINEVNEDQQQTSSGDQDLMDALNEALMENGESVPSNEDKGEETSEE